MKTAPPPFQGQAEGGGGVDENKKAKREKKSRRKGKVKGNLTLKRQAIYKRSKNEDKKGAW